MTKSTFYHDGYRDACEGRRPSPPSVKVYRLEYIAGYADAEECMDFAWAYDRPYAANAKGVAP